MADHTCTGHFLAFLVADWSDHLPYLDLFDNGGHATSMENMRNLWEQHSSPCILSPTFKCLLSSKLLNILLNFI